MKKDEFIAKRLRDEAKVLRVTVPILIVCVVAAVGLTIFALMTGRTPMSLGSALIMFSIAAQIPSLIERRRRYEDAEREIVARIKNPDASLSETTENLIDHFETQGINELKQMFIVYLLMGIMLVGMGVFLYVILSGLREGNIFLEVILPIGMAAGGAALLFMAFNAWRNLKIARDLQALEERE